MRARAAIAAGCTAAAWGVTATAVAAPPAPIDPQNWSFQDNLTWSDYKKLPGPDYSDPSIQPTVKKWKVALVLADFPDREFIVTQPPGSTIWGTPTATASNVPRAAVPQFYADFLNEPSAANNFQTMNRYWMEDSFGKYGVELTPIGPYRLDNRAYQYFINGYAGTPDNRFCPTPSETPCLPTSRIRTDIRAKWDADPNVPHYDDFDNVFYTVAGEDQSSTWQEFGEMKFLSRETVSDAFGPKAYDPSKTANWAPTRYVPWSAWAVATNIWPNAQGNNSTEAESSGMATYAHELSHNLRIPDNYNNPFAATQQRTATGMWDMMSRGSFNGPGGQHTRFQIPPTQGGSLGAQHNLRNKRYLDFVSDGDLLRLNRDGLAQSGMAVAEIKAREVAPNGDLAGVQIALDGAGDLNPVCDYAAQPTCEGPWRDPQGRVNPFHNYTVEVVQQIGSDSFLPGHGVLIGKTKNIANNSTTCGSFSCFVWYIDANPQDINQVDYLKADGTPVKATIGDERQTNDASFNVGLNSGSTYEYEAANNKLHFYILDKRTDAQGVLHYKVGVRSTAGAGPQTRGVSLGTPTSGTGEGFTTCTFPLKNTGAAAPTPDVHPQDASAYLGSDIYRLSATASGTGWTAHLRNALATAKFGETVPVPVYVEKAAGAAPSGSITLTATSESDPAKSMSATCTPAGGSAGGSVPATLSLTMGAAASFGPFTPGLGKDYFATTTATVTSTAGDATLTVADPSTTATGHLVNGTFSLPEPLQASGSTSGTYSVLPSTLKTYGGPASNDAVNVSFKQPVKSSDALRTGTYSKTLTFTLSTTTP